MVAINPQKIEGKWQSGVALDFQTTSSTPIGYNEFGHMQFSTVRPEIAELLYRLKYKGDRAAMDGIVSAAAGFLRPHVAKFDLIIPVPPSTPRSFQPVIELAKGIGTAVGRPVFDCVVTTRPTTQLKNVSDPEKRKELLEGLYMIDPRIVSGRSVLLFDDLFRSGATMNAISEVLVQECHAATVRALTITRTRSNR